MIKIVNRSLRSRAVIKGSLNTARYALFSNAIVTKAELHCGVKRVNFVNNHPSFFKSIRRPIASSPVCILVSKLSEPTFMEIFA